MVSFSKNCPVCKIWMAEQNEYCSRKCYCKDKGLDPKKSMTEQVER